VLAERNTREACGTQFESLPRNCFETFLPGVSQNMQF
jgi:hypothetical protein